MKTPSIAQKRIIALRMGITAAEFDAYLAREAAKRKARKAMSPEDRLADEQAEREHQMRVAAESRAARMKANGIDLVATVIEVKDCK